MTFPLPVRAFLRHVLPAAFFLLLASLACGQAATGTIEGRVFNARRGEYVENARITVDGSSQQVLTDSTGQYRLTNIAAGTVTLKIFYTGLGSSSEIVAVAPGQTVQRDITLAAGESASGKAPAAGETIDTGNMAMFAANGAYGRSIVIRTVNADAVLDILCSQAQERSGALETPHNHSHQTQRTGQSNQEGNRHGAGREGR